MTSTTTTTAGDTYQIGDHTFPATPQIDLLRHYAAWVEWQEMIPTDEREWDQGDWLNDCGTAYCFAGKVAIDHDGKYQNREWVSVGDYEMHISEFAARTLGIATDAYWAGYVWVDIPLFSVRNDAAAIRWLVEAYAREAS